jgi:hypothetical protein
MAINLTSLPQYVEERRLPLIKEAVLSAKSASLLNLQTDVKWKAAINLVSVAPVLQDGSTCGWSDAGSAELSQRVITAPSIKINQAFCEKDFLKYWTGYEVKVAAGRENLPFEEYFTSLIVEEVKAANEKLIWQGDTASDNVNYKWTDGLLKLIAADSNVVKPTIAEGATAYDAIKAVYLAIPEKVLDKAVIFVGADVFRQYMQEMVEKNYYHYAADGMPSEEFIVPGTNTRVIAVNGLNGTNKIVAARTENLFLGVDMADDVEKFEMWYSKDFREFRLAIEFNLGVNFAFGDEIVLGTIA